MWDRQAAARDAPRGSGTQHHRSLRVVVVAATGSFLVPECLTGTRLPGYLSRIVKGQSRLSSVSHAVASRSDAIA